MAQRIQFVQRKYKMCPTRGTENVAKLFYSFTIFPFENSNILREAEVDALEMTKVCRNENVDLEDLFDETNVNKKQNHRRENPPI